jgi:hypothetical protein
MKIFQLKFPKGFQRIKYYLRMTPQPVEIYKIYKEGNSTPVEFPFMKFYFKEQKNLFSKQFVPLFHILALLQRLGIISIRAIENVLVSIIPL